jgi:HSP20 family protein
MANLGIFQPFQDLVGDLGRELVARPLGAASQAVSSRLRLDVDEDDQSYTIRAELPGARKEDIRVSVEGNQVSLGAEVRREADGAGRRNVHSERSYGSVTRTFTLPAELDAAGASAQYQDGVLTVVVPKKSTISASRVPVS